MANGNFRGDENENFTIIRARGSTLIDLVLINIVNYYTNLIADQAPVSVKLKVMEGEMLEVVQ